MIAMLLGQVQWKEIHPGVDAISPQVFTLETLIVLNNKDICEGLCGVCLLPHFHGHLKGTEREADVSAQQAADPTSSVPPSVEGRVS